MPATDPAPPAAGLSRERLEEHTVIAIIGELDIASTPSLRERLNTALRNVGPRVVIDLSGVTFCDASGLALLVGARRRAEPAGTTMVLAAPRPQMAKLLRITGLTRAFTIRPSVTAARPARPGAKPAVA
ncbi:STAS domain-containing protein [Actinomadura graeca]|uniref:Anti-sigma factor antagonist n=1 Tax=Actinomadura graeca TaxID=2750812 RepID=A0ABX8QZR9_9ACTN|nr:STAS domain-containing protein [Actinomadura graeca]QXJ22283.1 STAS domain-containing protein [Actinomadura graeca]